MLIEEVLAHFQHVKRTGKGWLACCPGHDDLNPSLSISLSEGKILLHCHAGCSPESVCAAAGIEMRDLFSDPDTQPHIVEEYRYVDETGELLFETVRLSPKDFRQRRPDGKGGWIWNLKSTRRVLYRLPELPSAKLVLIVEGEKDCETARKMDLIATCNPLGAGKWHEEHSQCLHGKRVVVIADADEPGRKHAQQVAGSLHGKTESLKVIELPCAKDLSEWVEHGGTRDALLELIRTAPDWKPTATLGDVSLVAVTVEELLRKEIRPRKMLLDPILPEQGLGMLYAYRGLGKTLLALGMSAAVASGGRFLRWTAPEARRVLYVDGELPAKTVQERTAMVLAGLEDCEPDANMLKVITPDFQNRAMPDLSTIEGQRLVEQHLDGVDLLILDNLSALCRYGNENESESWLPMQEWLLTLRRRGISVLLIHHAGKNRAQRGTSKREDLLDIVMTLKHSANYNPSEGLRCEVHFEKTRVMLGDAAKPFEVRLETGADGRAVWTHRNLENVKVERAAELFAAGWSVRDVAEELAISRSAAGRLRQVCQLASRDECLSVPPQGSETVGRLGSHER